MARIITFGELMLRLAPNGYYRFFQDDQLQATFGGAEANVAVSLANFGLDSAFVTRLPQHAIGQAAVDSLRRFGVDTSHIVRGGERVGIYFLEKGASQRGAMCIYDRAHSAIQTASPADFDWDAIFTGADWFHLTGITPALGGSLAEICRQACKAAKARGVRISFDTNYRSKLWTLEEARPVLRELCSYADMLITNAGHARDLLGVSVDCPAVYQYQVDEAAYRTLADALRAEYGCSDVAMLLRTPHSASDNTLAGMLATDLGCWFSRSYPVHIVDRVGGGDSFAAGLIYGCLTGQDCCDAVNFAVAASVLKHTIEGDYNRVTAAEAATLAFGDATGIIRR